MAHSTPVADPEDACQVGQAGDHEDRDQPVGALGDADLGLHAEDSRPAPGRSEVTEPIVRQ